MRHLIITILMLSVISAKALSPEQYQAQIQQAYLEGKYQKYFELACQYYNEYQSLDALLQIAEAYSGGEGVDQNPEKAAQCYDIIIQSIEQAPSLTSDLKALLGYCHRMHGVNNMQKYDLNHVFTRQDMMPFHKGAEYGDAFSMYMIGHSFLSGDYKSISEADAITFLQRAADKNCITAISDLGGYYDDKGDSDKALQYYIKGANTDLFSSLENANDVVSLLVNPNNTRNSWVVECHESCIYNVGHAYYAIEEEAEALKWLEKLTIDVPKYLNLRAQCYLCMGDKEKALRDLKRSVQLEPDSKVYDLMGMVCAHFEDFANAEKYFNTAIRMGNTNAIEHKKEYMNK